MTQRPLLGAVLAGGRSERFGSDKALARLGGRTLLEQAVEALGAQCDAVIVVGREDAPAPVRLSTAATPRRVQARRRPRAAGCSSSSKSSASFSSIVPPSCSASTMVTARR